MAWFCYVIFNFVFISTSFNPARLYRNSFHYSVVRSFICSLALVYWWLSIGLTRISDTGNYCGMDTFAGDRRYLLNPIFPNLQSDVRVSEYDGNLRQRKNIWAREREQKISMLDLQPRSYTNNSNYVTTVTRITYLGFV